MMVGQISQPLSMVYFCPTCVLGGGDCVGRLKKIGHTVGSDAHLLERHDYREDINGGC